MRQFTEHAKRRSQQRSISKDAVEATLDWGRTILLDDGRRARFIGRKEILEASSQSIDLEKYIHTLVVVSSDQAVVTVIRTSELSKLSKKGKKKRARGGRRA